MIRIECKVSSDFDGLAMAKGETKMNALTVNGKQLWLKNIDILRYARYRTR